MCPREQAYIRTKQGPGSNGNRQAIDEDAVGVDEYIFADDHVEAIVSLDGWFDPGLIFEELIICYWILQLWREGSCVLDDTDEQRSG